MNNNGFLKGMLIALLVLYVASPVDFMPGPVDDILLMLLTAASNLKRIKSNTRSLPDDTVESVWRE